MDEYVVSRELAERLKDAGFPQTTEHLWNGGSVVTRQHLLWSQIKPGKWPGAPLSDEILAHVRQFDFTIINLNSHMLSLSSDSLDDPEAAIFGKNFAEVLANFWLELKANNYLEKE